MAWTTLCDLTDLTEKQGKYVEVDGFRLAVFLNDGQPYTMDDRCPHANGSMSSGDVMFGCAICPRHGWAFELKDGALRGVPGQSIPVYPTRVHEHADRKLVQADLPMV